MGNWEIIQLLKAGVGSFMLLYQTNKNKQKPSLEYEEGVRVEGSKQTEVDPLWDFRDCAKQRIWYLGKTGKCWNDEKGKI